MRVSDEIVSPENQAEGETMKITYYYLPGCPYCRKADRAIEELIQENPSYGDIEIERINEKDQREDVSGYDYYYVPSMFIGKEKIYEADPSQHYDDIKQAVRNVLETGLNTETEIL